MYTHFAAFQALLYLLFIFLRGQRLFERGGGKEAKDTGHLLCGLKGSCLKAMSKNTQSGGFYSRAIPGLIPPPPILWSSYTALNQRTGWSVASERNVKNWDIIPFPVETINKEG